MNNQKISAAWIGFSGNIIFSAFYESGNKLSEPSVLLFLSYYLPLLGLILLLFMKLLVVTLLIVMLHACFILKICVRVARQVVLAFMKCEDEKDS